MSTLTVRYVCRVYAPDCRKLASVTAIAHSPSRALASAMKGAQKIPLHLRNNIRFEMTQQAYTMGKGAFSKPPIDNLRDLSQCPTLC